MEESERTVVRCYHVQCCDVRARFRFVQRPSLWASSRGFHEFPTTVRFPESSSGRLANRCPAVALFVTAAAQLSLTPSTSGVWFTVAGTKAIR